MQTVTSSRDGRFAAGELPGLLRELLTSLEVGRLQVTQRQVGRYVWFEGGRVRAVTSKAEEEKLGNWLAARGVVDRQAIAMALLRQPQSERLGYLLIKQGLIDERTLHDELSRLALTIAGRMLFEGGVFQVDAGLRLPPDALTLDLTPTALLVAATRHTDEDAHLERLAADHHWKAQPNAIEQYRDIKLLPQEGFLLSRLTEPLTFVQLRQLMPMQEDAVMRALATLVVAGLVEPIRDAVASAREQQPAAEEPGADAGPGVEAFVEESWGSAAETGPTWAPPLAQPPAPDQGTRQAAWRTQDTWPAPEPRTSLAFPPGADLGPLPDRHSPPPLAGEPPLGAGAIPSAAPRSSAMPDFGPEAGPAMSFEDGMHSMDRGAPTPTPTDTGAKGQTPSEGAEAVPPTPDTPAVDPAELERAETNKRFAKQMLDTGGDARKAVKLLQEAVDLAPDASSLVILAQLEIANPLWRQRALDHLKKAVEIAPQNTEAWLALSNYWGLRGQPEKQRRCLQRILSYEPRNDAVREAMAYIDKPK